MSHAGGSKTPSDFFLREFPGRSLLFTFWRRHIFVEKAKHPFHTSLKRNTSKNIAFEYEAYSAKEYLIMDDGNKIHMAQLPNDVFNHDNRHCSLMGPILGRYSDLKQVYVVVEDIDASDIIALNACKAEVFLTLCGERDLNDWECIQSIEKLTSVTFQGFGTSTFPPWISKMDKIASLSFVGTRLAMSMDPVDLDFFMDPLNLDLLFAPSVMSDAFLPKGLQNLDIQCNMDRAILENFLHHGSHLIEFRGKFNCVSACEEFGQLGNLESLKLCGKEVDNEIFKGLSKLTHLEILHLDGSVMFTKENLEWIEHLVQLRELSISSAVFCQGGCHVLSKLTKLKKLRLASCFGIELVPLESMSNLKELDLDHSRPADPTDQEYLV